MSHSKSSVVAPYFSDIDQQRRANMLGMWAFLATEVMFFGGVFIAYTVYRLVYPQAFAEASRELNLVLSGINTLVLLTSSLMMALAVHAAQTDNKKGQIIFLTLTILLGLVFLGLKFTEYAEKFQHNLVPGPNFVFAGPHAAQAQIFFSLYFVTTGLHALHMIIGVGVLLYFLSRAARGHFSSLHYDSLEMVGLYWHFVDIAWVFIFPLYYLIDRT